MLAFWFVLIYNLLEDRRILEAWRHPWLKKFTSLLHKQIDSLWSITEQANAYANMEFDR